MRIKSDFVLREIAGEYLIVTIVKSEDDFNGLITVDEIGKFLWDNMQGEFEIETLVDRLTEEYDVKREEALSDVTEFVDELKKKEIVI